MEHPYILPYLEQRMLEIGFKKFHFETVRVVNVNFGSYQLNAFTDIVTDNQRYGQYVAEIDASNQFYFLVEKVIAPDLKITSDTGYLIPSESLVYSNNTFNNFKEFSGQIFITSANSFDLEFIRVTPYE